MEIKNELVPTMHPYIPHLLNDITAAHRTEKPCQEREKSFAEILEEITRMKEDRTYTFGYFCGLRKEDLPPSDQLLKKEMKLVSSAFKKMMRSWNLSCWLPKGLPADLVYDLLIWTLERKINPLESGMVQFSYCSMDPANCLLGLHCTCLKRKASEDGGSFIEIKF
ncbi:hypothetical protein HB364_18450 [Pseudoflavitalea sp. X16]|uniref:hypothetical protein n=1 Tax=Paraflavitalea devenefica TaxID=2716334 RepID=UPI0014218820|nr:hypothetical protein [Paraflavitalea devenefica]NII27076.1 hypothetical protein [Paraflavitalea devenefica]